MRYYLRELMILMAVGPPTAAAVWFGTPKSISLLMYLAGCHNSG